MTQPEPEVVWRAVAANRLLLADWADRWDPTIWDRPTLCEQWNVRQVVAHVTSMATATKGQGLRAFAQSGAKLDRASDRLARHVAHGRTDAQLVQLLRDNANARHTSPGLRPVGILAEVVTHLLDLSVAVGQPLKIPTDDLAATLAYLQRRTRGNTRFNLTVHGRQPVLDGAARTAGLLLHATDIGWRHNPTAPADPRDRPLPVRASVEGPAAALILAMAGRPVAPVTSPDNVIGSLAGDGCVQLLSPRP